MKIEQHEILVRDVAKNYIDTEDDGVKGYDRKLDIRPPYQREFVYRDDKRNAVISTVMKGFPLNVMYWVKNGEDDYEVLDGQQRTISLCQYIQGDFSINEKYFHSLTKPEQDDILNYKLMVYICEGNDKEKLDWFKTINIAGERLTDQELRNAIYAGPWLTDAKKYFSKNGCPAYKTASDYLKGSSIRQDYLETTLSWIASRDNTSIEEYMSKHQFDENASELWQYFQKVIAWTKATFPTLRKKAMQGNDFGLMYNKYKDEELNAVKLEEEISKLMADSDVTNKKGIYWYVLDKDERRLNVRTFDDNMKQEAYEHQNGICPKCDKKFDIKDMEADHITPWSKGGKTNAENCQMLCKACNRKKSDV